MSDSHALAPAADEQSILDHFADLVVPSTRIDGWTGARQKRFLEAIADGSTVTDACALVGMSVPSAYAFRRRARGQAFSLGWRAADLLARERIAGVLLSRALQGQETRITRPDGSELVRHGLDNRLAVQMLNRLDRYADASDRTAPGQSARLVAAEFDAFLDLVGAEGGPARAGLFMLAREAGEDAAAELAPVIALARADRLIRCGTALGGDVPTADLDLEKRHEWTGEQWARAEAAGLVALAPAPTPVKPEADEAEPASTPILPSTCSSSEPDPLVNPPVWWDEDAYEWRTHFPPPNDFGGYESHDSDRCGYERALTSKEANIAIERLGEVFGLQTVEDAEAERDRWFGFAQAEPVDGE
ncbi:hypothetical protein [uncultured Sphingomonas sp.]|uniref:hypothetical protein n=1 Tax=uncultured Sphingomonas sp. TaxID=158754 RepID=UPI0035C98707